MLNNQDEGVAWLAGYRFAKDRENGGLTQGMTLFVKLDGVDHDGLRKYIGDSGELY